MPTPVVAEGPAVHVRKGARGAEGRRFRRRSAYVIRQLDGKVGRQLGGLPPYSNLFAIGALAIGRLAICRVLVESAEFQSVTIQHLTLTRLRAAEIIVSDSILRRRGCALEKLKRVASAAGEESVVVQLILPE